MELVKSGGRMSEEYPKIHSLWMREGHDFTKTGVKTNGKNLIEGAYSCEEFGNIHLWDVEEKIDGTNIRIFYEDGRVSFGGRTDDAQIPCHLLSYLMEKFTPEVIERVIIPSKANQIPKITLFGEGYGPKIQSGGYYSKNVGFCLFDVKINHSWLSKEVVRHSIAEQLGVLCPPHLLTTTIKGIQYFVKEKHFSRFAMNDPLNEHIMEGVVCRPVQTLLFRKGSPVMFKLKCKDFK